MKFSIKLPISEIFYNFRALNKDQEDILLELIKSDFGRKYYQRPEESLNENLDYLEDIGYIGHGSKSPSGWYHILPNGIIFLAENQKTNILEFVDKFLKEARDSSNKNWDNNQIQNFLTKNQINNIDGSIVFRFLDKKGFFDHYGITLSSSLPMNVLFSSKGWRFVNDPKPFVGFIRLDKLWFNDSISDEQIHNWLSSSNAGLEGFQKEYKLNTPPENKLKRDISCLANGQSGVLCIGFNDADGKLVGVDNPDNEVRRVNRVLREFSITDEAFTRIIKINGKFAVIVFVPKTENFLYIGEDIYLRIEGECLRLSSKESVEQFVYSISSIKGHKWFTSLKRHLLI